MIDDLPFSPPDPATARTVVGSPKRCRRHVWIPGSPSYCINCEKPYNPAVSRRGRNNRKRGNAAELDVARTLGAHKMGPLGLPWDVERSGYLRLQVKKVARWPSLNTVVGWMNAIPAGAEMRGVALIEPGRGGRRLIVLDLDEYAEHHGDPLAGGK